ncbi:hypothetical protein PanWU01x14_012760 [Parasponia andersonii]|uniref:Uncharacterized protein n=1 Tax=Parasponia andersonii TaxID=3476 RepID=A0A2P5E1Y3_PARAD|nr:hypothetical protein PanWU01x14_012760 [Parasponia andersonii]
MSMIGGFFSYRFGLLRVRWNRLSVKANLQTKGDIKRGEVKREKENREKKWEEKKRNTKRKKKRNKKVNSE